jgi:hypothetical protein
MIHAEKRLCATFVILGLTLLFQPFLGRCQIGEILRSFPGPGQAPTGIAFDGQFVWIADASTGQIYRMDRETGQVLQSFAAPDAAVTGLAWDGTYLWCTVEQKNRIYCLNPSSGAVEKEFPLPSSSPAGLTFVGDTLYYVDSGSQVIYHRLPGGTLFFPAMEAPSADCWGLTWDGSYFWASDRRRNESYLIDPATGLVLTILPLPGKESGDLTWDGQNFWVTDPAANRICCISLRGTEKKVGLDTLTVWVEYRVETRNEGSSRMYLSSYFAVPEDGPFQKLLTPVSFNIQPEAFITDQYGQKVALFYDTLEPQESVRYFWQTGAKIWGGYFCYLHERTGSEADIPQEILRLYTRDGDKYQIKSPVIQAAVQEALQGETRFYWKVRKIHDYVISHVDYYRDGRWDPAPIVLQNGTGSCSEYTVLFVAMCRAAGIPARYEAGGHIRGGLPYTDTVYHRWAQVYFPGIGWVPVDCTWDDRELPADQARYFGGYAPEVFVTTRGGGGSYYLGWYYNLRQVSSGGKRKTDKRMQFFAYTPTAVRAPAQPVPTAFDLAAFPNPVRSRLMVRLKLQEPRKMDVFVANLLGQHVAEIYSGKLPAGEFTFFWDGRRSKSGTLPSGVYFLVARGEASVRAVKITVLR